MNRTSLTVLACLLFCAGWLRGQQVYKIPVSFDQSPVPPDPDYARRESWASLPDMNDPADKSPRGLKNGQATAAADVFFIHPTSFIEKPEDSFLWNAPVSSRKVNKATDDGSIRFQASLFNESCRVYAPRYRQAHYYCFLTPNLADKQKALSIAYTDVRSAFQYYLKHHNAGRPIVIAAHSQGTVHAHRLLREFFEDSALRNRLVVAYLPGMPVPADSFRELKPCRDSAETGCWCSWRTYRYGHLPRYSNNPELVVTNPLSWTTDTFYRGKEWHRGAVLRDFEKVRRSICDAQVHEGVLWIHRPEFPGSRLINNPNYHAGDYNLFYMDVRENVKLRLQNFSDK